jgi:hypothetical protein
LVPYPEPYEASPCPHILVQEAFHCYPPIHAYVFKVLFLLGFWVMYTHYLSLTMRATCIVNLILPDFITPFISGEEYKLCSSLLRNFLKTTAS